MSQYIFKMPDLGEGTVEAEIVCWHAAAGDAVREDQTLVEVMTDKAAVEVPSPVSGRVIAVHGAAGDRIAVGAPLVVFETGAAAPDIAARAPNGAAAPATVPATAPATAPATTVAEATGSAAARVMASPANRRRAREAGIALSALAGTGPGGRILRSDIEAAANGRPTPLPAAPVAAAPAAAPDAITEIKIIGVRRVIAERMSEAKRTIPHFAYVEEVDVTELESLRRHLNERRRAGAPAGDEPALTYLPLVIMALARVLESFPQCNALYDSARGVLVRHRAVHVGIATQTPDGLKVPVVRNAHALSLPVLAAEIRRLADRARSNRATREELVGSTITVTSLGRLGGIASTPVINAPEVAIIGLNKAMERPVVLNGAVAVRRIMNLSSSFDHRFVDGYDAAAMIQALKEFLEHPATIFIPQGASP
jgi:2-oxoisovalerate dehydrogenase E2 component (dihydrolipoyl transacylase)